jgi:hypothetical protein
MATPCPEAYRGKDFFYYALNEHSPPLACDIFLTKKIFHVSKQSIYQHQIKKQERV